MSRETPEGDGEKSADYGAWTPAKRLTGVAELIKAVEDETGQEVYGIIYRGEVRGLPTDVLVKGYKYVDRNLLGQLYWNVMEHLGAEAVISEEQVADVIPIKRHEAAG